MEAINASALDQKLDARGLLRVGGLWGWHAVKHNNITGWEYPIYNPFNGEVIGTRFKSAESSGKFKYGWLPSKPSNPLAEWYTMPTAIEAIREAGGVVYVANGEPALLAYHAAQVYNVIATTLSEIAVPKNIKSYLKDLGVNRLLYPIDNDAAGHKSAVNWRDALRGSGIDYEAFTWGKDAPAKADSNDIWIQVGFDASAFQARLKALEGLVLPEPEPKPLKQANSGHYAQNREGLIELVMSRLGIAGAAFKSNGWTSKNFSSPFREDKEPSAGFNRVSGSFKDFGSESLKLKELAVLLGIDVTPYYPEKVDKRKRQPKPVVEIVTEEQVMTSEMAHIHMYATPAYPAGQFRGWIDQDDLPHSWVKTMLHLAHAKSPVANNNYRLHRAVRNALIDPECFTADDLMRVLELTRKAADGLIETNLAWTFFRILPTISSNKDKGSELEKKSTVTGRPKIHYALNCSTDDLRYKLAELIEPCLLERLTDKELAPRTPSFRDSLDLDLPDFKAWHERTHNAKHDYIVSLIQAWVCSILEDDFAYSYSDLDLESPSALRGKMLRTFLEPYSEDRVYTDKNTGEIITTPKGIQISHNKIAMMLGCSESLVGSILKENNIGSQEVRGWHKVENPNLADFAKEWREAAFNFNRALGGRSVGVKIRPIGQKGLKLEYKKPHALFKYWDGRIERMDIWVQQPSLLWNMTTEEIEAKAIEDAEKAAAKAAEKGETLAEVAPAPTVEKKPRKPNYITGKDRVFVGHSYDWKHEQLALETHVYTPYKLSGMSVVAESGDIVAKCDSLKSVVMWLNENASKTAIRTIESYYEPVIDLEEYQEPIALDTVTTPELKIVEKAPMPAPQKGVVDYPLDPHSGEEYHDYLNNPYITEWERENRKRKVNEWRKESLANQAAAMNAA